MTSNHAVTLRLARTTAFLWFVARAALALLGTVVLGPLGVAAITPAVVALTWLELKISRERIFYANLGVSPGLITVVATVVVLSLEVVAAALLALFAPGLAVEPLL